MITVINSQLVSLDVGLVTDQDYIIKFCRIFNLIELC